MENGSNVSDMLDDEINIMLNDWPETKDMLMKGNLPNFFNCIIIVFFKLNTYKCTINCITKLYISTYPN